MSTGHSDDVAAGVGRIGGTLHQSALGEVVERRYEVAAIDIPADRCELLLPEPPAPLRVTSQNRCHRLRPVAGRSA